MSTAKTKRSDKTAWIVVSVVGIVIFALGTIWGTLQFGHVEGEEFSPDTFTRRKYSYYQVPLIRLQISGIDRTTTTGDLELHLTTNKIVTVQNSNNPAWHTIRAKEGNFWLPHGDAAILFRYVGESNAPGGVTWLDWTTANANMAAVLWPAVAQLARDELYFLVPDLLAPVAEIKTAAELTAWIDQHLADEYVRLGDARRELGYTTEAAAFYRTALKHQADHAGAKKGLAELPEEASAEPAEEATEEERAEE